jgi:hypothetical protein
VSSGFRARYGCYEFGVQDIRSGHNGEKDTIKVVESGAIESASNTIQGSREMS